MKLGKIFLRIRKKLGISQHAMASELGVTPGYVSLLEADKRKFSLAYLELFSKQVGIPLSVIYWVACREASETAGLDPRLIEAFDKVAEFHGLPVSEEAALP